MKKKQLIIGKTALFNHRDMGLVDATINQKIPLGDFYSATLKKVHHKDVRVKESALSGTALLLTAESVDVFVQPQDLVRYK